VEQRQDRIAIRLLLADALLDGLIERGLTDHMILSADRRGHQQNRETDCERTPNYSHLNPPSINDYTPRPLKQGTDQRVGSYG
jgi:hypothetical protein